MIRQAGRGMGAGLLIIKVLLILSGLFLTNHMVWTFYAIIHIWTVRPAKAGIVNGLNFFLSLFGL